MEEKFVNLILKEAQKAYNKDEVPVGCIIVKNNKIISKAHNLVEKNKSVIYHAEIIAIKKASKKLNNWRLNDCIMYVTLEPCQMCSHAINLSRISKVYYLLKQQNSNVKSSNHIHLNQYSDESKRIIKSFFINKRN